MSPIHILKRLLDAPDTPANPEHPLARAVRTHMPATDEETQRVVTAIAGLLACVAYADLDYSDEEKATVREELARIHGLERLGVDAIVAVLAEDISVVVANGDHGWVRDLRELTSREQRIEILEVLLDLAAADGVIDHDEVNYLRRLTTQLGLEQRDYNTAQAHHRDKLGVLTDG